MWKKALCLIFAFLLSIESFAAAVSDNDGSAFITKAEFDSLKNDFQSKLDAYNTNIDSKIDNAIASYLSGLKVETETYSDGYLKSIININPRDTVFKIGENLGVETHDQFLDSVKVVNPYVAINHIANWGNGYYEFDFYSHDPSDGSGTYNGQFDNTGAGANIVSVDVMKFGLYNYVSLNEVYKVRKWQFQAIYTGNGENMSWTYTNTNTFPSLTIDFTGSKPFGTIDSVDIKASGGSIGVVKALSNKYTDEYNCWRAAAGSFYGVSNYTTDIFGWKEDDNYIYDTTTSKTEKGNRVTFQRRFRSKTDGTNFSYTSKDKYMYYKLNMPTQYKFKFIELINKGASQVLGEPVFCYQGLPIITTNEKTKKIKIPLNISNFGTVEGNYALFIADEPFDNYLARNSSVNIIYADTGFWTAGNREITLEFSEQKKRTLWLKINPEIENNENISFKIELQTNKQITETLGE